MSTDKTLAQVSKKDKPWKQHRINSMLVENVYSESKRHYSKAQRMRECSNTLMFSEIEDEETGKKRLKLKRAHFCRVRLCPICQWRRGLALQARFMKALPEFQEEHPDMRYIYVVLTVRNPELSDLRVTIQEMNKAWARMRHRKAFKFVQGWVKTLEITKSKDGTAHPHINLLLAVKEHYFTSRDYLNKDQWIKLWRDCARLDYDPSVFVRRARKKKAKPGEALDTLAAVSDAAREVFKYAVKEQDLVEDPDWLLGLTEEVHRLRFFAAGGLFKDLMGVDEEGEGDGPSEKEMIYLGEDEDHPDTEVEAKAEFRQIFSWMQGSRDQWNYWFRQRVKALPLKLPLDTNPERPGESPGEAPPG